MSYEIRIANIEEIELMTDWAASEKWNPGLNDAKLYQSIDPHGFFIGYLDDKPISCISTVKYNSQFSFLGFYIVKPEFRGQGFGYQIWQHAIQYAKKTNIGLDGVIEQQENYKKSGFQLAHKNTRYVLQVQNISNENSSHSIIQINKNILKEIFLYDRTCFPCERNFFLTEWIMKNTLALVYLDNTTVKGYGVIRACRDGYKIGPLFADNIEIALAIFKALIKNISNTSVYLDIPETNLDAKKLVEILKMQPVFETARMYTLKEPEMNHHKIFGITSFEVG